MLEKKIVKIKLSGDTVLQIYKINIIHITYMIHIIYIYNKYQRNNICM